MRNRKLYATAVLTTVALLFTGCGNKAEPVSVEVTNTVSEIDTTESLENTEPAPSPTLTVEPTEEPIEEKEEIEEETPSEEIVQEESESDLGYEIIPMDDTIMYCTSNSANVRKGPNTSYDKVGTLTYAQEITVNGKVESSDSTWFVIKTDDNTTQMVSGSLLSTTKPQPQQTQQNTGNTGSTGGTGGGSSSSGDYGGIIVDGGGEIPPEFMNEEYIDWDAVHKKYDEMYPGEDWGLH